MSPTQPQDTKQTDEKPWYELSQRFYFEAAHTLRRKIETEGSLRIHGHTYEAEITVSGYADPKTGMLVDLGELRQQVARVKEMLDHRFLDDIEQLGPATLENLCGFIRKQLKSALPQLSSVTVERKASGDRCVLRERP
ncbi:MAG: 6-carboxytetrahydropterin synthase [Burkholderiaceae bacterium]|jgi:6-pyruvoyltetrahydropterin/6-carboxytetrahydropterin synthase|nr:6-carboxytetrahydropterin synthase [Burkholderiaceae bacterium]MDP4968547.1 6-carboxytetrahydropterin synthase [Burkholderiaceae bacterium]